MEESTPKELFLQSLKRCLADDGFIPAFYERFLNSSDEIKDKFRHTDFDKQVKMLARSLELCAGATSGEPESLIEIRERGETHDRNHLNIEPRLYEYWLDNVILTAAEFDKQWSDTIEDAWHRILGHVVQHMSRMH